MQPIPEKMKLNKFRKVHIPRNRDLLARYGLRFTNQGASVPDDARSVDFSRNKLDNFMTVQNEIYQNYAREQNERERIAHEQQQQQQQDSYSSENV